MSDFYQRFVNPGASDRKLMGVLHGATLAWGVMGTVVALALVQKTESALDTWWTLSSILSGGIVGLFLLGMISRRAGNPAAILSVATGTLVIAWMVLSKTDHWPEALGAFRNPLHDYMVIVVGTVVILVVGLALAQVFPAQQKE
jgi:SSS family solute:Na+ symporter